jgi:hypothetical protein
VVEGGLGFESKQEARETYLILGEQRIAHSRGQHHGHQERNDSFHCHGVKSELEELNTREGWLIQTQTIEQKLRRDNQSRLKI